MAGSKISETRSPIRSGNNLGQTSEMSGGWRRAISSWQRRTASYDNSELERVVMEDDGAGDRFINYLESARDSQFQLSAFASEQDQRRIARYLAIGCVGSGPFPGHSHSGIHQSGAPATAAFSDTYGTAAGPSAQAPNYANVACAQSPLNQQPQQPLASESSNDTAAPPPLSMQQPSMQPFQQQQQTAPTYSSCQYGSSSVPMQPQQQPVASAYGSYPAAPLPLSMQEQSMQSFQTQQTLVPASAYSGYQDGSSSMPMQPQQQQQPGQWPSGGFDDGFGGTAYGGSSQAPQAGATTAGSSPAAWGLAMRYNPLTGRTDYLIQLQEGQVPIWCGDVRPIE